jgi:hypothetical protein
MHFLANENFPLDAVQAVRNIGHDVAWIRTDAPGSKVRDILQRAVSEQRILLTFDKDFGDLAFQLGLPASLRHRPLSYPGKFVRGARNHGRGGSPITNRLGRPVLGG